MTDDKSKMDERESGKVAGGGDYEMRYLAEKRGINREQERELVKRYGNNRETLIAHARNLV